MRVVFMGTPGFAVPSLMALASAHDVVAVFTRPDMPSGRGREPRPSAVKEAAVALGLPPLQPPTLRDPAVVDALAALRPDVVCVAAYGLILPQPILDVPVHGCVNVHASLLPRWRGAAPIQRAILAGDELTGVSIMRMEAGLDTGPVARMLDTAVDLHTTESLSILLGILGARALLDVLDDLESGSVLWEAQRESGVTYADKVTKADVALVPEQRVDEAWRRVRASSPQAPSRMDLAGTPVTVQRATPVDEAPPTGTVLVTKRSLIAGFADGGLGIDELTPQGRKPMEGAAFARGARLETGDAWQASS